MKIIQIHRILITRVALSCTLLFMTACTNEEMVENTQDLAIETPISWNSSKIESRTNGTESTIGNFSAIAAVDYCWGESVRFFGTVENKVNEFTDANGIVHYTRHWSIKGLNAIGLGNVSTGLVAGAEYTVVAGAEMFTVTDPIFNAGGVPVASSSGKIYIHQGTIVLQNNTTGDRLVARHVIKKNPNTGEVMGHWYCMGK